MKRFIGPLLLCLTGIGTLGSQELTDPERNISAPAPHPDRWVRVGLIWGSTALDLVSTKHALATNPDTREGNPMVCTKDGGLHTGKYLALILPLNVAASYANLKYPNNRAVRVLTYVSSTVKIGFGVSNLSHSR
jgi:hypothetical protein